MAKKKESQQLANPSTTKKPLKVAPPAKKPSEASSSAKRKPLEVGSSANKKQHLKIPPPGSSDDDEDEKTKEEEENESESSSEEEEEEEEPKDSGKNQETPSASAPIVTATATPQSSDAESESESESEGDSDSETEPDSTKPWPPPAASASPKTKTKRPSEGAASSDVQAAKRAKSENGTDTPKMPLFQRIWSEEDEIVILQGMIDFKADTGKSPNFENMNKFYETLKKPISFENKSYRQFTEKITSLKRKYLGKRNGVEPTFTKTHDQRCFELAKKIWGSDNDYGVVKTEKMMTVEDESLKEGDWFKRSFLVRALMSLGWEDEALLMESWSIVPTKMKKKIEEKWKLVRAKDNDCVLLKMDLMLEVVSMIAAQAD